ncbi:uncharacterized protein LOC131679272 [Topomyia yanbarensis]|uniref:uncharacterized protein LOC131679272 n=1 Tax=Topomyia yanbarensis TaxID=2498891 RepID=UPI00273AF3B6|nr:uncharacterized protein LOC131679272 [Topomyia yanbarensis]
MNGLVERQNQGILRALRIAKATNSDWRKAVKNYVHMYNTSPNSMTGKAPMELMTGRPVKDLLPSLRTDPSWRCEDGVRESDAIKKLKGKIYADQRRHAVASDIKVGDIVLLRNYDSGKLEPKFTLKRFTVVERKGNDTIVVNEEGLSLRRCVTHLKKLPLQGEPKEALTTDNPLEPTSTPTLSNSNTPLQSPTGTNHHQKDLSADSTPLKLHEYKRKSSIDKQEESVKRPARIRKIPRRYVEH